MLTLTIPADEAPRATYCTFHCSEKQAQAIAQLRDAHKGFGAVEGYKPSTDWKVRPTQNIQFIAGFIVSRLYKRQIDALRELTFADLDLSAWVPNKGRNACDNAQDQFDLCIGKLIDSKTQSLAGELENAHTEAHDRNYCAIANSIKVNFVTEKDEETGKQMPVLDADGIPTVSTILVPYLEVHKVTVTEGERKVKNSGSKVLMDNAINKAMGKRFAFKMLSLKDDNFDRVRIGREVIEPTRLSEADKLRALFAKWGETLEADQIKD